MSTTITLDQLKLLDPELLSAALAAAKVREVTERLAHLPKCGCGKVAAQVATATTTYRCARIRVDEETGYTRVGEFEDFGDVCPGETENDDGAVWLCCDDEACYQAPWRAARYHDVYEALHT